MFTDAFRVNMRTVSDRQYPAKSRSVPLPLIFHLMPFAIQDDKAFTLQICKLQHRGVFILEGPNETDSRESSNV